MGRLWGVVGGRWRELDPNRNQKGRVCHSFPDRPERPEVARPQRKRKGWPPVRGSLCLTRDDHAFGLGHDDCLGRVKVRCGKVLLIPWG